ncbi:TetR/AcrR family transcriptional regulator [Streptomyces sp. NPDC056568]|uniref:TetR/AcrR family transcriptional regulator n=1 Tax=Streptomyces sp. NPDC056568 TaxID=3345866 RepID=UPI00368CBAED
MSPAPWTHHNPLGTGNVISTVRTLMRTDGLNVSVTAIARASGTSRNYLYENWKTASGLHLRALQTELARAFDEADRTHPSDGTVDGIVRHLTQVVRTVRRHPTTSAVARTSHTALPRAHAATDGPLVQMITGRVSDLLHPLAPHGGVWSDAALFSMPWKVLWIARPAALCPEAVGDQEREDTLDGAFAELLRDLLAPWSPADRARPGMHS